MRVVACDRHNHGRNHRPSGRINAQVVIIMAKQILVFIGILLALCSEALLFAAFGWWALLPLAIGAAWAVAGAVSARPDSRDPQQSPLEAYLSKQRKD